MRRVGVFVVVILLMVVVGFVGTAAASDSALYAGGDGNDAEPYEIANWTHLDNIRENLNANFTLVNDLNKSTDGYDTVVDTPTEGFDPIGNDDEFTGTFDGDDHTIIELTINRSEQEHVGLFGEINGSAVIENVNLESADITGDSRVGGLVGYSGVFCRRFGWGKQG